MRAALERSARGQAMRGELRPRFGSGGRWANGNAKPLPRSAESAEIFTRVTDCEVVFTCSARVGERFADVQVWATAVE